MTNRQTYLNSVLDQLQIAIRNRDTGACEQILLDAHARDPKAAEAITERLIAAGWGNIVRRS